MSGNVIESKLEILNELNDLDFSRLNVKEIKEFSPTGRYQNIKAITFDGLNMHNNKTKAFAYLGFPEDNDNKSVPAMVLVHGGAGYPFLEWVKRWNDKGFAAIAVSTVGVFPERINAGDKEGAIDSDWTHTLKGVFEEEGYVATPDNDDMRIRDNQDISTMWMYHAVSQVILAGKVISSYENIDKDRIGALGISWGSVILSIALGYENPFSYAINVYGSGYLTQSLSFMRFKFILPIVQDLWLAEKNFEKVDIPVLWICMNNDTAFSANSNSLSYLDTFKNNKSTTLSIKEGWIHGHSCCWDDINYPCAEIYEFAQSCVSGKIFPHLIAFSDKIGEDGGIWAEFVCDDLKNIQNIKANLFYLTEEYEYSVPADMTKSHLSHYWEKIDAEFCDNKVFAKAPKNATVCYIQIVFEINGKKITVSTPFYPNK